MKKELALLRAFHEKFHVPVLTAPSAIPEDRYTNRYKLMKEEVDEYLEGAKKGDVENVAKELCDILYSVYGTILEHGLQEKMPDIFAEVHRSHMTKDYHQYKMVKGDQYTPADLKKFFKT